MKKKIVHVVLAQNPRHLVDLDSPVLEIPLRQLKELLERPPAAAPTISAEALRDLKSQVELADKVLRRTCDIATNAWRARAKMIDPASNEPYEAMARVYRHVENILEDIAKMGLRLWDPNGEIYDSGMALKVVAFQPTPGLQRERVLETIRPSVYWEDRLLQMGEVIVGTPETSSHNS